MSENCCFGEILTATHDHKGYSKPELCLTDIKFGWSWKSNKIRVTRKYLLLMTMLRTSSQLNIYVTSLMSCNLLKHLH